MESSQIKRCSNCLYGDELPRPGYPCFGCGSAYEHWRAIADVTPTPPSITHPAHYKVFAIEPLDFCASNNLDFLTGNIIKYVCRYPYKGGVEDLKKAQHYLEKLMQHVQQQASTKEASHEDAPQ